MFGSARIRNPPSPSPVSRRSVMDVYMEEEVVCSDGDCWRGNKRWLTGRSLRRKMTGGGLYVRMRKLMETESRARGDAKHIKS